MLFLLLISLVSANWWEGSKTTEITDGNIDSYIGRSSSVVLEFYAPWCHWCHRMFEDYEGVWEHFNSEESSEVNMNVIIARVNAQGNPNVIARYDAYAYPTVLFIPAGTLAHSEVYNGNRSKWDFIRWTNQLLVKYAQSEVKQIRNEENFEAVTNHNLDPTESLEDHESKASESIPSFTPKETPEETQASEEEKHNHEEEDPIEEDLNDTEDEYEILYEVTVNEDASDFLAKWRGELSILNGLVTELHEDLASSITDIENGIHEMKALQKEEKLRDLEHFERIEEKIEGLDLHILQRNRVESTQTRLNLTHLFIFSSLGFVVGCAISIIFVKIQKTEKPLHNKV